ncbi:hypothetical protein Hanom_Chr10g00904701 [Helianthus anomalus]
MKVKTGSEPVPGTANVSTELVLRIFRFRKFGTGTHYYLLLSDYGFLPKNIITIQLFSSLSRKCDLKAWVKQIDFFNGRFHSIRLYCALLALRPNILGVTYTRSLPFIR